MELTPVEHKDLKTKLARLANDAGSYSTVGRTLEVTDPKARLEAILIEVDDSMLAETLVFRTDTAHVTLAVSGRRLLGISEASGVKTAKDVLDNAVSPEDTSLMSSIHDVMTALVKTEGSLTVSVGSSAKFGDGAAVGASVAQLRSAWGLIVEQVALDGETPIAMLASGLSEPSLAMIIVQNGEITTQEGAKKPLKELTSVLEDQLDAFVAARVAKSSQHSEPSLTCLVNAGPDGAAIVVATDGKDMALFCMPAEKAALAHQVWRQIS